MKKMCAFIFLGFFFFHSCQESQKPSSSYKVLILSSTSAEKEMAERIAVSCKKLGWECQSLCLGEEAFDPLQIDLKPDFTLSLNGKKVYTLKAPNYLVVANGEQVNDKVLDFDGYLLGTQSLNSFKEFIESKGKAFKGISWFPSCSSREYVALDPKHLFYSGFWADTRLDKKEHKRLLSQLDNSKNNKNSLEEAGMALVLHPRDHFDEGSPIPRLFEAAAASSLIISDRNPFVVDQFGDSVLYVDEGEALFDQVDAHVKWALSHKEEAQKMAQKAHSIFVNKFTLEKQLLDLAQFHESGVEELVVDDRNDWIGQKELLESKIRLLNLGLKEDPENETYQFHLAQAFKVSGKKEEALALYSALIAGKNQGEKAWYSRVKSGEIYEDMGDWDAAQKCYLEAYEENPKRAEPLCKLATHYRVFGPNALAYHFAKRASTIPIPDADSLFVSDAVYDYRIDEELSITADYTSFREEGFQAVNRLALNKNTHPYAKEQNFNNMLCYVRGLDRARYKKIEIDLPFVREDLGLKYRSFNPSILKTESGYDMICKTANHTHDEHYCWSLDPSDSTIRTRNFFVQYDRDFNLLSQKEIIEDLPRKRVDYHVVGHEDARIFEGKEGKWFISAVSDVFPGKIIQTLCRLSDKPESDVIKVDSFTPLSTSENRWAEKNWLPIFKNNALHFIYSYSPFVVVKPNLEDGFCEKVIEYDPPYDFSAFRGSAAPIEFEDGYLLVVHEVISKSGRHYLHRLVYLDKDFMVQKISKPFNFKGDNIEFCCGMTLDHSKKDLILTVGIDDCEAYLCFIDLKTVDELLEPLPKLHAISETKKIFCRS